MVTIPLYRANKINSNDIVIGFLIKKNYDNQKVRYFILEDKNIEVAMTYEIDEPTLSIHFPDMLDSQGNKIFASLSEDGKGGDKFLFDNEIFIIWFDNQSLKINATNKDNFECNCHDSLQEWYDFENKCYDLKVIGIQQ